MHVRPTHFASAVATGMAVTGPTDDGFIHLHFFREVQRITNDEVPSRSSAPNEVELAWTHAEPNIHLMREEVAVISVPVTRLPFIGTALNKAVRFVANVVNGGVSSSRARQSPTHVAVPGPGARTPDPAAPAGAMPTRPRAPA
ncbi:hypothetical protein [Luteibacter yeojuensis]|uniref:Uncharacterized protein n=1 Tax=Luteibacter yeojuensis TaxID=345309 RepID=A0A7X5QTB0_9GAMM|nr:hypothetical protein [Luteibacter yeojuensis]NID15037.1 hypothetical protein [Luteibacter yeojuensis]